MFKLDILQVKLSKWPQPGKKTINQTGTGRLQGREEKLGKKLKRKRCGQIEDTKNFSSLNLNSHKTKIKAQKGKEN
jgi:hypothetical protein